MGNSTLLLNDRCSHMKGDVEDRKSGGTCFKRASEAQMLGTVLQSCRAGRTAQKERS